MFLADMSEESSSPSATKTEDSSTEHASMQLVPLRPQEDSAFVEKAVFRLPNGTEHRLTLISLALPKTQLQLLSVFVMLRKQLARPSVVKPAQRRWKRNKSKRL
jgi:hypothetical protein